MISACSLRKFAVIGLLALLPVSAAAQGINSYSPVTDVRLANPEPENWLMYRRTYDSWSYSPLDKINTTNVKRLAPVWSISTGVVEGHQAPPIVNDGVMFVATPQNQVLALNAKTGQVVWEQKVEDYTGGYYMTLAPLVAKGKV